MGGVPGAASTLHRLSCRTLPRWLACRSVSPCPCPHPRHPTLIPSISQVALRIRPMSAAELAEGAKTIAHRVDEQVQPPDGHPWVRRALPGPGALCPPPCPVPIRGVSGAGYPGAGCDPWCGACMGRVQQHPAMPTCARHGEGGTLQPRNSCRRPYNKAGGRETLGAVGQEQCCLSLSPILDGGRRLCKEGGEMEVGQQRGSSLLYGKGQNLHCNGSRGTLRGAIPGGDRDTQGARGMPAPPPRRLAVPRRWAPWRDTLTEVPLCRRAQVGAAGRPVRQVPWHRARRWL